MSYDNSTDERLRLIAQCLGVPVEQFFGEDVSQDDGRECLRLWDQIATPEGQAAALEALRRIIAEEGG